MMDRLIKLRKFIFIYLIIIFSLILSLGVMGCEDKKDDEIAKLLTNNNIEEAKQKVIEYYSNDEEKQIAWLMAINEEESNNYKSNFQIQEGWTWKLDGNYTYIKGRVKNIGDKTIRYFKVTAQYKDQNGNVLDTDYTNSNELIIPGNAKEFEIMHEYNDEYYECSIFIDEVSLK